MEQQRRVAAQPGLRSASIPAVCRGAALLPPEQWSALPQLNASLAAFKAESEANRTRPEAQLLGPVQLEVRRAGTCQPEATQHPGQGTSSVAALHATAGPKQARAVTRRRCSLPPAVGAVRHPGIAGGQHHVAAVRQRDGDAGHVSGSGSCRAPVRQRKGSSSRRGKRFMCLLSAHMERCSCT